MKEKLIANLKNAYTPYSNYQVSCIIKMHNGDEISGVNIENGSLKSGLCAEQVAISAAVAEGYTKEDFQELYVMGSGEIIAFPCFICRQLLLEFFNQEATITSYNKNGDLKSLTLAQLTPYAFAYEEDTND